MEDPPRADAGDTAPQTTQTPVGGQHDAQPDQEASAGPAASSKSNKRGSRGLREILSLGQPELLLSGGGRPSRRAATAAQAAMAHTIAFERQKGSQMTPPKPPGSLGLAQRMLQAFEDVPEAGAPSPMLPGSQSRKSKRQAAVAVSGASSAADQTATPTASIANGLPASSADDGSDWDDFQGSAGRKKRPAKKQSGIRKSRAPAGRSRTPKGRAAAPAIPSSSGDALAGAADSAQPMEVEVPVAAAEVAPDPADSSLGDVGVLAQPAAAAAPAAPSDKGAVPRGAAAPESSAAGEPAAAVDSPAGEPAPAVDTAAAEPAPAVDTAAAEPAPAVDTAAAEPAPAVDTVAAEPAPALDTAAAEPVPAEGGAEPAAPRGHAAAAGDPAAAKGAAAAEVEGTAAADLPTADSDQPASTVVPAVAYAEVLPVELAVPPVPPAVPGALAVEPAVPDAADQPAAELAAAPLPVPQQLVPASLSHYPLQVLRLAALIRSALGLQRGQQANLRMVMKTALLDGQEVRFQNKAGKVLNTGVMNAQGMISCGCSKCHGKSASCSEFEEHAGSRDRRPADGIFLTASNVSMRDLVALVNNPELSSGMDVHMEVCYACKEGGDLLCCDGCTAAFHLGCASLEAVPEGDWFCSLCLSEGKAVKRQAPLQLKLGRPSGRGKQRVSSNDDSDDAAPSKPKKMDTAACSSPTGRVHMAAPSMSYRRPGGIRRGRNSNKHKRLFEGGEGSLPNGEKVAYITSQGEKLLEGEVVISPHGPSGILCYCCNQVISCSQFEAHAGRGSRRAPYDNIFTSAGVTLKAIAAMLPELDDEPFPPGAGPGEYDLDGIVDGCRDVINELDTVAGGCVLCHQVDFQRGGFGPRTVLFCDQCEREFHVGCLKAAGTCDLQAVPEGDWFCSQQCTAINQLLISIVQAGQIEIPESPGHTWQLLRGKDGTPGTTWSLKAAQELLQESFDPIMDLSTNTDLLPLMIYARQYGEWDYKNVHVMLLRHKGKPVVAAIMRVFGPQLAELPLIATKLSARRQGHARVLLKMFDELLTKAGVHRLCLPAAHETVLTWRQGFHYVDMPEEDVKLAKQQLRILVFPGTEMLWKDVQGVTAPQGHHVLVPPPEQPKPEPVEGTPADAAAAASAGGPGLQGVPAAEGGRLAGEGGLPLQPQLPAAAPAAAGWGSLPGLGPPAWPENGRDGVLPGHVVLSSITLGLPPSTGHTLPLQPAAAVAPTPAPPPGTAPAQWPPSFGTSWALQQQVWGGTPVQQHAGAAALQSHAAYPATSLPQFGGGYFVARSQGPRPYAAAQPIAAPTSAPPPPTPQDMTLDSYDSMFEAAMAAADLAAEQVQPATQHLREPAGAPAGQLCPPAPPQVHGYGQENVYPPPQPPQQQAQQQQPQQAQWLQPAQSQGGGPPTSPGVLPTWGGGGSGHGEAPSTDRLQPGFLGWQPQPSSCLGPVAVHGVAPDPPLLTAAAPAPAAIDKQGWAGFSTGMQPPAADAHAAVHSTAALVAPQAAQHAEAAGSGGGAAAAPAPGLANGNCQAVPHAGACVVGERLLAEPQAELAGAQMVDSMAGAVAGYADLAQDCDGHVLKKARLE